MSKIIFLLFVAAMLILSTLNASGKKHELVNSEVISDWSGMVKVNKQFKRSGTGSFELFGKYPTELISSRFIPIDMNKSYTISAWFRSVDANNPASGYLGLRMYDKNKKEITIANVSPYSATETILAAATASGNKELLVKKNVEWLKKRHSAIAFNTKENYKDLPNHDLSPYVNQVIDQGEHYKVILKKALSKSYPAGTKIRLHTPWEAPLYSLGPYGPTGGWLSSKWRLFSKVLKGELPSGISQTHFFKDTKYVRVFAWFGNWNRIPKLGAKLLVDDIRFTSE